MQLVKAFLIYLLATHSIVEVRSLRVTGKAKTRGRRAFETNSSDQFRKLPERKHSSKQIASKMEFLRAKAVRSRSQMTNDQIINTSALALDTVNVLADITTKFIEGKIYKQKFKIAGGVEKLFFFHYSVKESLCVDFLKFNSAYGDMLTSLKLQYISDYLFFVQCTKDSTCHQNTQKLPLLQYLITNTIQMKAMIDETFQAMKSNEDTICNKTIDFAGEVEYIKNRANLTVNHKNNFTSDDATKSMTSSTWTAVGSLLVAVQTGQTITPGAKEITDGINNVSKLFKEVGTKISETDAYKKTLEKLKLNKVKKWAEKKFKDFPLSYLPFAFEVLTNNINIPQLIVEEIKAAEVGEKTPPKSDDIKAVVKPATPQSNFTFNNGNLMINNECIKLPLGGCNLADWIKTLKETYEIVKFVVSKETWKNLTPEKLLEVAANLVYLGIFGVKIYYFINDLITNQGSAQNVNKSMTALSGEFWFKTLDYVRKFLSAQKKVMDVKNDYLQLVIDGKPTKENEKQQADARNKRKEVIKAFVSELSSYILTPLIKRGLNYLITYFTTNVIKNYLSTTLVSIKLIVSFYNFSKTMYSLITSIPTFINFRSKNVDAEVVLQNNFIEHINNHSTYIKCKYLLYLWEIFSQHSEAANQNILKMKTRKHYFNAMRFKELSSNENKGSLDCNGLVSDEDLEKMTDLKARDQAVEKIIACKTQDIAASEVAIPDSTEETLKNDIKSVCYFNIGFCKMILTKEYILTILRQEFIDEIAKELSYYNNFGPITFVVPINKLNLTFDTDFFMRRNFAVFRNEQFGEHRAVLYSRRPGQMAINSLETLEVTYEEGNFLNAIYDQNAKSSLSQIEIINDFPIKPKKDDKKDDKKKEVKVNVLRILYSELDDNDEEIDLVPSFNTYSKDKKFTSFTSKWNKSKKQWTSLPLGKGNLTFKNAEKLDTNMPSNLENGFPFFVYLIPKSRQFKEQWLIYELNLEASNDKLITYFDNRFLNDWNHNEFLLATPFNTNEGESSSSTKKQLGTIIEKSEEKLFEKSNQNLAVYNELCGDSSIKSNFDSSASAASSLNAMEAVFKKRESSLSTTIKSLQETLCRLSGHFYEEYELWVKSDKLEKKGELFRLVAGSILVLDDKVNVTWKLDNESPGNKDSLFKANVNVVSSIEIVSSQQMIQNKVLLQQLVPDFLKQKYKYLNFFWGSFFNSGKQLITFNDLQNLFLNPYSTNDFNIENKKQEDSSPFNFQKKEFHQFDDTKHSWRENLNGLLFLHHSFLPPEGSLLKGKKALSDFDSLIGKFLIWGEFHIIFPVFIGPNSKFSTEKLAEETVTVKKEAKILELFQMKLKEESQESVLHAQYGSIGYVEFKIGNCEEDKNTIDFKTVDNLLDRGYIPIFPKPESSNLETPLSYFYQCEFHSGNCIKTRLFVTFNYFLNKKYSDLCKENGDINSDANRSSNTNSSGNKKLFKSQKAVQHSMVD